MNGPTDLDPKIEQCGNLVILTFAANVCGIDCGITRELGAILADIGDQHLLLDFTNVKYLNGEELGALITTHSRAERAGGRLTLFNLSDDVFLLF